MAKVFKTGSYTNDKVSARRESEEKKIIEFINEIKSMNPILKQEIENLIENTSSIPRFSNKLNTTLKEKTILVIDKLIVNEKEENLSKIIDKLVLNEKEKNSMIDIYSINDYAIEFFSKVFINKEFHEYEELEYKYFMLSKKYNNLDKLLIKELEKISEGFLKLKPEDIRDSLKNLIEEAFNKPRILREKFKIEGKGNIFKNDAFTKNNTKEIVKVKKVTP